VAFCFWVTTGFNPGAILFGNLLQAGFELITSAVFLMQRYFPAKMTN